MNTDTLSYVLRAIETAKEKARALKERGQRDVEVADRIMLQLGGYGRLSCMIGIRHTVALEGLGGLGFQFPNSGPGLPNCVEIRLNGLDTYDVEFKRIHNCTAKTTTEHANIHCAQLKGLFEKETGLYLTL